MWSFSIPMVVRCGRQAMVTIVVGMVTIVRVFNIVSFKPRKLQTHRYYVVRQLPTLPSEDFNIRGRIEKVLLTKPQYKKPNSTSLSLSLDCHSQSH